MTDTADQTRSRYATAAIAMFVLALIGALLAIPAYWANWPVAVLGGALGLALTGTGLGIICWAGSLDVDERAVQEREPLTLSDEDRDGLAELAEVTEGTVGRRPALRILLGGAVGAMLAAAVGPLVSLGPKPPKRARTAWRAGSRVVTADGTPIRAADGALDQLVTAFPEGHVGRDDSQIVLLRVDPSLLRDRTVSGGAVDGWVAYSKICTHAGCSVGLFGVDPRQPDVLRQLVCPCHQSVFDPLDGAQPRGGPATRSLPQLPLAVDPDGNLIATRDFDRPVGPIAWNQG